jgi:hypothetical protein
MSTILEAPARESTAKQAIPPLRAGDRLTADEYDRRYDAMPGLKKAELINGVVYMPSPVYFEDHAAPHFDMIGWMSFYRMFTPGVRGGDNSTLRLPLNNRPQPDGCLLIDPSHGGQAKIDEKGYIVGAPECVGEVAATSENYDLHDKLEVYERNRVQEYIVWRVFDQAIDWFQLRDGKFVRMALAVDGCYHSEVFPGLWLDPAALIHGDMQAVFQAVQRGCAAPEHAAFVARFQQAGNGAEKR